MRLFKKSREDVSSADNELLPKEEVKGEETEEKSNMFADTLGHDLAAESEFTKLDGLLEKVARDVNASNTASTENLYNQTGESAIEAEEDNGMSELMDELNQTDVSETSGNQRMDDILDEATMISEKAVIRGTLESTGSFDIRGVIYGDVSCEGKLEVSGYIFGNTTSSEFFADGAKMEGEIESTGTVKIGRGSRIIGNIKASCAVIAGALKGDIDVQGPVVIDATAVIKGNIKSRSVQINNGAVIEGFCSQCYANTGVEDIFGKEETDDISGGEEIDDISGEAEMENSSGEEKEE